MTTLNALDPTRLAQQFRPTRHVEYSAPQRLWQRGLVGPASSFRQRSGKKMRAALVALAYDMAGGAGEVPAALGEFIELLHAGSLIVDDIEDNAETRRGQPALHRVVGLPVALNTGNWMYFAALEKLGELPCTDQQHGRIFRDATTTIRQCHEGQALDLVAHIGELRRSEVLPTTRNITRLKTGGLTSLAARLGALLAGATTSVCRDFAEFGMQLGVALQMKNDLDELRKCAADATPSVDLQNGRVTWPWAWLSRNQVNPAFVRLQRACRESLPQEHSQVAQQILDRVGPQADRAVREQLRASVAVLERGGRVRSMEKLQEVIRKLEPQHA